MENVEEKKCEYCASKIFRRKGKMGTKGEVRVSWTQWARTRFCSKICKIKGTKGEFWNKNTTTLFKKGRVPHNKGVITSKVRKAGGWTKLLRKDPQYYVSELRENAFRNQELKYDEKRKDQIRERREEIVNACGIHGRQDWRESEITFLEENILKMHLWQIALKLERSYSSVVHKVCRLGLVQNNKWITK